MKLTRTGRALFVVVTTIFLVSVSIYFNPQKAEATSYTSTTSGDWLTNATWGGSGHPLAGDTATIASGTTVTFNGDDPAATSCAGITINSGGTLTFTAGARTLTVQGAISASGILDQNQGHKIRLQQPADTAGFTATYIDTTHIDLNTAWTVEDDWRYHYYHNTTDNEWRWATAAANNGSGNVRLTLTPVITAGWNGDAITQTHPLHNGLTVVTGGTYNATGTTVNPITINTTSALVANTSSSFTTTSNVSGWLAGDDIWVATTTATRTQTEKVDVVNVTGPVAGQYTVNFNGGGGAGGTIQYDHSSGALGTNVTRDTIIRAETQDGYHNAYIIANTSATSTIDWDYVDANYLGGNVTWKMGPTLRTTRSQTVVAGSSFHDNYYGLYLDTVQNETVTTSNFFNNTNDGLNGASTLSAATFTQNNFFNNSTNGLRLYGQANSNVTSNNSFSNVTDGYFMRGSGATVSSNNAFSNSANGINTQIATNNTFSSNIAYYNGNSGIRMWSGSNSNTLTSNQAYNNTQQGIVIDSSNSCYLNLNIAHHNTASGIYIYNDSNNNTITSNDSYNNTLDGLRVYTSGDYNTAYDNDLYSNTGEGIYLYDSGNNTFVSNNIYSNHSGIYLYLTSGTNNYFINNNLGGGGQNTAGDVFTNQNGVKQAIMLNNAFNSPTEVDYSYLNTAGGFIISKKHDQTNGLTRFWGDRTLTSGTEKYNYAENTYSAGATTPNSSAGTGNGTISAITTPSTTINETYRATVTTAAGDNPTFTITRSGGATNPATLTLVGGVGTYTEATTGISFTITDGATDFVLGDSFVFGTYAPSGDGNVRKQLYFHPNAVSLNGGKSQMTFAGGSAIELRGGSGANQETQILKYDSGGIADDPYYNFIVRGTGGNPAVVNASYFSFAGLDTTGLQLGANINIVAFNHGSFNEVAEGGSHLTFDSVYLTDEEALANCIFDSSGTYDVTATNNSRIIFTGSERGNLNDNPDGTSTVIWNPEIALITPPDSTANPAAPILKVNLSGLPAASYTVNYYLREKSRPGDFMLVQLPDFNGLYIWAPPHPEIIATETQWVADNKVANNIQFATQMGDMVDDPTVGAQWTNTNTAMNLLNNVVAYGVLPGNHEFNFDPGATHFNTYYPYTRYQSESWWGGHYGTDNNNNYQLMTMGGNDYIIFHLGYGAADPEMAWVNGLLTTYSNRRAIISTHECVSDVGNLSGAGLEIYNHVLASHNNIFAVLCGHGNRGRATISVNNRNVSYIEEGHGGDPNGYLKTYRFSAADDKIHVRTYSPSLNNYDPCANCEFNIDYETRQGFRQIGSVGGVSSGQDASLAWSGATEGTDYEWYAETVGGTNNMTSAATGTNKITSTVWSFKADKLPTLPETGSTLSKIIDGIKNQPWFSISALAAMLVLSLFLTAIRIRNISKLEKRKMGLI